ncbi:MAG: nucleotidyltransferase family protein [Bacteroidales bacterium]
MKPTLLVLAAGMGSRYGGLKQIDPIGPCGETIIDYSIYDAVKAGFGKVVFVIRRDIEADFREIFLSKFANILPVEYVFQEIDKIPVGISAPALRVKPWGTGHAILMASEVIHEPFAVINADDFYGADAYKKMASFLLSTADKQNENEYAMVGYLLRNTMSENGAVSRGVCKLDQNSFLENVSECTNIEFTHGSIAYREKDDVLVFLEGDSIVSMNFWGFMPAFFSNLANLFADFIQQNYHLPKAEFYIPSVVDDLIKSRSARVKVLKSADQWFGVTYKEDKPIVIQKINQLIRSGIYPEKLWK